MTENENVCNKHLKEKEPQENKVLSLDEQITLFVEIIIDIYLQQLHHEE